MHQIKGNAELTFEVAMVVIFLLLGCIPGAFNKAVTEEEVDSAGVMLAEVTSILGDGVPVEQLSRKQKAFIDQLAGVIDAANVLRNSRIDPEYGNKPSSASVSLDNGGPDGTTL